MIGDDNMIIEVDEAKFGKIKYNRGHKVEGVWVLGAVERSERRKLDLTVVEKRDVITLEAALKTKIKNKRILFTDCLKGYNGMNKIFAKHQTVNHSRNFKIQLAVPIQIKLKVHGSQ